MLQNACDQVEEPILLPEIDLESEVCYSTLIFCHVFAISFSLSHYTQYALCKFVYFAIQIQDIFNYAFESCVCICICICICIWECPSSNFCYLWKCGIREVSKGGGLKSFEGVADQKATTFNFSDILLPQSLMSFLFRFWFRSASHLSRKMRD